MDQFKVERDANQQLTAECRANLTQLRDQLRTRITAWDRGARFGRLPDQADLDQLVDNLLQFDELLGTADDEAELTKMEAYDDKLERIREKLLNKDKPSTSPKQTEKVEDSKKKETNDFEEPKPEAIKQKEAQNSTKFAENKASSSNLKKGGTPKSSQIEDSIETLLSGVSRSMHEFNILLLGETGAGKSTTINAFANYIKYGSFDEASAGEFIELIPSKFTLPDPKTGNPMVIKSGSVDKNEKFEEEGGGGVSVTQGPQGYTFPFGNRTIRIIDTPGMGDTRGVDKDKENFDKILSYLHQLKNLHGILILMKATETRRTTSFRYCINELLTHLHKSACANIVVCYTFSRNSFYGPGEGFATLKDFLEEDLKDVQLVLEPGTNCFFIDNEAFRYLVAKKQDYPFVDGQEDSYRQSWNKSVEQTKRMMQRILRAEPHDLKNTTSLNNARKLILELAEPMVQLQKNARANIDNIKNKEKDLNTSTKSKEELARNLHLEVDDLESKPLDYPSTVCTARGCCEVISVNGNEKFNYKQRCHERCGLSDVQTNQVGHPILKGCAAMSGLYCHRCGCKWDIHMHLTCEYIKIKRTIIDKSTESQIKNADDAIAKIENALKTMRKTVEEYEHELKVIQEISSKFAYILITNANTPYNRFIEPYLDRQIEEEEQKINSIKGYPTIMRDSLKKMKDTHHESVQVLLDAMKNKSKEDVRLEDIGQYRDQLFQLKHSGSQFKQMTQTSEETQMKILALNDKSGNKSGGFFNKMKSYFPKLSN